MTMGAALIIYFKPYMSIRLNPCGAFRSRVHSLGPKISGRSAIISGRMAVSLIKLSFQSRVVRFLNTKMNGRSKKKGRTMATTKLLDTPLMMLVLISN